MKSYSDIADDGGSDVAAQIDALGAAVERSLAGVRHLVAVASGKGGVGKSTVTVALARACRHAGRSVAILDADFNGPCQARMAGLEGAPWIPGPNGITLPRRSDGIGVLSLGSLLGAEQPTSFASVSQGDERIWRATREYALLAQLLAGVRWGELDLLLVDLPPGTDRSIQHLEVFGPRAAFVLVTIPSQLARGVVARSLSALRERRARIVGYVENMAGYLCPGCHEVRPLFPPSGEPLAAPCLGSIPFDPALAACCDTGWDDLSARPGAAGPSFPSPALESAFGAAAERLLKSLEDPA